MPRALKDFREAEAFHEPHPHWDAQDRVLLVVLTTSAIAAITLFAFVALGFFAH